MYTQNQAAQAANAQARNQDALSKARASNLENEFIERATRARINNRAERSALIARQGSSGLTSAGSAELILGKAAAAQELAIADAARQANQQASDERARGQIALYEGKQATQSARLSMLGTALSTGSSLYGSVTTGKYQGTI
jgi:hypothetical protein